MLSLFKILTIALYEFKSLMRSKVFKIFSFVAIAFLIYCFGKLRFGRSLYAIPSSIPYSFLHLLNVVQAILGIFIASEFLAEEKKMDTTDAIYTRSMTIA